MLICLRQASFTVKMGCFLAGGMLVLFMGCKSSHPPAAKSAHSYFLAFTDFSSWKSERVGDRLTLVSPPIQSPIAWKELVPSWNVDLPDDALFEIEVAPHVDGSRQFCHLGRWSPAGTRESVRHQKTTAAEVKTDVLVLKTPAQGMTIRLSLSGRRRMTPLAIRFLGLSFCNPDAPIPVVTGTSRFRDRSLSVPGLSQLGHAGASGWCSPTSVAMVLQYWANETRRDDLKRSVPEVAAGVHDRNWPGTGNWPFNTAYAGSFPGMRAYVTRFDSLLEVEEWIAAGVPVILSAPYNLLSGDPEGSDSGHVVVCTGFTSTGDVRINDPFTRLNRGQSVARIYQRGNVEKAWKKSDNTVYLIYLTQTRIPRNTLCHWESSARAQ